MEWPHLRPRWFGPIPFHGAKLLKPCPTLWPRPMATITNNFCKPFVRTIVSQGRLIFFFELFFSWQFDGKFKILAARELNFSEEILAIYMQLYFFQIVSLLCLLSTYFNFMFQYLNNYFVIRHFEKCVLFGGKRVSTLVSDYTTVILISWNSTKSIVAHPWVSYFVCPLSTTMHSFWD